MLDISNSSIPSTIYDNFGVWNLCVRRQYNNLTTIAQQNAAGSFKKRRTPVASNVGYQVYPSPTHTHVSVHTHTHTENAMSSVYIQARAGLHSEPPQCPQFGVRFSVFFQSRIPFRFVSLRFRFRFFRFLSVNYIRRLFKYASPGYALPGNIPNTHTHTYVYTLI